MSNYIVDKFVQETDLESFRKYLVYIRDVTYSALMVTRIKLFLSAIFVILSFVIIMTDFAVRPPMKLIYGLGVMGVLVVSIYVFIKNYNKSIILSSIYKDTTIKLNTVKRMKDTNKEVTMKLYIIGLSRKLKVSEISLIRNLKLHKFQRMLNAI